MSVADAHSDLSRALGPSKVEIQPIDWPQIERALGLTLPGDYKNYADHYPALNIDDYLRVYHPTCSGDGMNLMVGGLADTANAHEMKEDYPDEYPYPIYPDAGGMLSWGSTSGGHDCFWLTVGNPDKWPVVIYEGGEHWTFNGSFTDFVVSQINCTVHCPLFPEDFSSQVDPQIWQVP